MRYGRIQPDEYQAPAPRALALVQAYVILYVEMARSLYASRSNLRLHFLEKFALIPQPLPNPWVTMLYLEYIVDAS